jgi:hypothetical protein
MDEWSSFANATKTEIWGTPTPDEDPHALWHRMKFDDSWNVRPGWNAEQWMLDVTGGIKFGTRGCHTATYQSGKR